MPDHPTIIELQEGAKSLYLEIREEMEKPGAFGAESVRDKAKAFIRNWRMWFDMIEGIYLKEKVESVPPAGSWKA